MAQVQQTIPESEKRCWRSRCPSCQKDRAAARRDGRLPPCHTGGLLAFPRSISFGVQVIPIGGPIHEVKTSEVQLAGAGTDDPH